jgi:uncharacterized protein YndB with AHSA1/START domain
MPEHYNVSAVCHIETGHRGWSLSLKENAMSSRDWSRFSQSIKIKAPLKTVYDSWTTRKGLERWFLRMAAFTTQDGVLSKDDEAAAMGGTYHWRWHGHPDNVEERGTVLEANGRDRLKFVFGKAGIVTVNLSEQNGLTQMEIVQEDIPTDEHGRFEYHVGCSSGWTFYRANMKAVLEGGVDIRNIGNNNEGGD